MSDYKINGLEVARLIDKNSRAISEAIQLNENLKKLQEKSLEIENVNDAIKTIEIRRKKVMRGIERRLRTLASWSDLSIIDKKKLISIGEAYRFMHPKNTTGTKQKRKATHATNEIPLPGYLYPIPMQRNEVSSNKKMDPSAEKNQNYNSRMYQSLVPMQQSGMAFGNQASNSYLPMHHPLMYQSYHNSNISTKSSNYYNNIGGAKRSILPQINSERGMGYANGMAGKPETSIYPGVTWAKGKYNAQVVWGGIQHYLGRFFSELEAARAVQSGLHQAISTGKLTVRKAKGFITIEVGKEGTPGKYWFKEISPELKAHMDTNHNDLEQGDLNAEFMTNSVPNSEKVSPVDLPRNQSDQAISPNNNNSSILHLPFGGGNEGEKEARRIIKILPPTPK
mmetsp:Transcript_4273/g.5959  ORF Transcript_4273/g.5959 Transcript_4273/m.5959 type:complete len:395 (+) Transcript_4273:20-1204(+)